MSDRPDVAQVIAGELSAHPAVVAWSALGAGPAPTEVRVLKERSKGLRKSAVYWLREADPRGGAVVAKLARRQPAAVESVVYGEVLPQTSVDAPRFHGAVDENEAWTWVFLEDVTGDRYMSDRADHRRAAAAWLAELHSAATLPAWRQRLPDRGTDHFLGWVRSGRDAMAAGPHHAAMTREEARTAATLHGLLDALDSDWGEVAGTAAQLPATVVHGDLVRKNLFVRRRHGTVGVVAIDWEKAGWGAPALDLAYGDGGGENAARFAASPCLDTYREVLRARGLDVDPDVLDRCAAIGSALRCVTAIGWSALSLSVEWVHHPMIDIAVFARRLEQSMAAAGIGGLRAGA